MHCPAHISLIADIPTTPTQAADLYFAVVASPVYLHLTALLLGQHEIIKFYALLLSHINTNFKYAG